VIGHLALTAAFSHLELCDNRLSSTGNGKSGSDGRMEMGQAVRGQSSLLTQLGLLLQCFGMARQLRIQYEGAIYHLMSRGDRREAIFRAGADKSARSRGEFSHRMESCR
jgi:hypothetical protein